MKPILVLIASATFSFCAPASAPAWVLRSNENALLVSRTHAEFAPEGASNSGVDGFDEQIVDLKAGHDERRNEALLKVRKILEGRLAKEQDRYVQQDLRILLKSLPDGNRDKESSRNLPPYFNIPSTVFNGIRVLLQDQVPRERRMAALVRLRRYAGMENGYQPITELATQRFRERADYTGLLNTPRVRVQNDLSNTITFIDSIGQLFEKYGISGYQPAHTRLKEQFLSYREFVRAEVLPRCRDGFQMPLEAYSSRLKSLGVEASPQELATQGRAAFSEIQTEMQKVALAVAKERGWKMTDYRDVIRRLKQDQISADAVLPHFKKRLAQVEEIIRRNQLVTLPERTVQIRLATAAESAQMPSASLHAPRLIGNTGEQGVFVLPLINPTSDGKAEAFDDFTYDAASWTLVAHETRPGHDLQYAAMLERGVSLARMQYAHNTANLEGWGLYAEVLVQPYMPLEAYLISLQTARLLRAARAFLDPELQMGKITPEEALRILKEDVVLSNAMARQEVDRYTFRIPGQATAFFYGYTRLVALRKEVEQALGPKFTMRSFHDAVLGQGLLPLDLLREAVLDEFVKPQLRSTSDPRRLP